MAEPPWRAMKAELFAALSWILKLFKDEGTSYWLIKCLAGLHQDQSQSSQASAKLCLQ